MLSEHSDSKRDPTTAPDSADSGKTRSASSLGGIGIGVACLVLVGMICVLIFVVRQKRKSGPVQIPLLGDKAFTSYTEI